MAIESTCSGCGQRLKVDDQYRGRQARCPSCGNIYVVGQDASGQNSPGSNAPTLAPLEPLDAPPASSKQDLFGDGDAFSLDASPPASKEYFAKIPNGAIYGPVRLDVLLDWMKEGRLNESCSIREGIDGNWLPAAHVLGKNASPPVGVPLGSGPNPFGDFPNVSSNPYASSPVQVLPPQGDQSTTVLMLGIFSWVLSMTCCIGIIPGVIGIVIGMMELGRIKRGEISAVNRTTTLIGFWLCVSHVILWALGVLAYAAIFMIAIANGP